MDRKYRRTRMVSMWTNLRYRYWHFLKHVSEKLARKYGSLRKTNISTSRTAHLPPMYIQFGSQRRGKKSCILPSLYRISLRLYGSVSEASLQVW